MNPNPKMGKKGGKGSKLKRTKRLHPHQTFRMYNPLKMDFKLAPTLAKKEISFDFSKKSHNQLAKMQAQKLKKAQKETNRNIQRTMAESAGGITVNGAEKVYEIDQNLVRSSVNLNSAKKIFALDLDDYAPYRLSYSRNGQYLALAGAKGHLSIMRWKDFRLISEEYFGNDYIHDVKFCFNESMVACAQREAVHIYNAKCTETHVLRRSMPFVLKLDFLPYHFLLTSIGLKGKLVYFDVSMGKKIVTHNTGLGECDMMAANHNNGIIHCGHNNGVVSLWTPTNIKPVAQILSHKSAIRGLAVDNRGYQMATSDAIGNLKIWDLRTYKELISYKSNSMIRSCAFSQRGLLAFSTGRTAVIWNTNKNFQPCDINGESEMEQRHKHLYLQHALERKLIHQMEFCPYEDVLGIAHSSGFSSIMVPGAGEPNYDIFEADPFETKNKRNNRVVYQLLDKLRPDMIQLDPNFVGNLPRKASRVEPRKDNVDTDTKFGRKALSKSVKKGYRGVILRRYYKYRFMKDLHHRQETMRISLNASKKMVHKIARTNAVEYKDRQAHKLVGRRKPQTSQSALSRFLEEKPRPEARRKIFSKFKNRPKKIYF